MSRFQCFHVSIYDPCMTFKFSILVHYDHDLAQINRKLTISFGVALYKIKVDQFDHWFLQRVHCRFTNYQKVTKTDQIFLTSTSNFLV